MVGVERVGVAARKNDMVETSSETISIGMIGAGIIGQIAHFESFAALAGCRIHALADLRPELAGKVASKYGIKNVYRTHHEILADPAVEAVVVVTPRPATSAIVHDALSVGRHVLSEKPMAHSSAQASALAAQAARARVIYSVGYMKRHDVGTDSAMKLVNDPNIRASLGNMILVQGHSFAGNDGPDRTGFIMTNEPRPAPLDRLYDGLDWLPEADFENYDAFLNVHVHMINIMRYITGITPTVTSVDFRNSFAKLALFDFDGVPGVLTMASVPSQDWSEGLDVVFEGGKISIRFPPPLLKSGCAQVTIDQAKRRWKATPDSATKEWAFRRQAAAFIDDIAKGQNPRASGADSVADIILAEAMWKLGLEQRLLRT